MITLHDGPGARSFKEAVHACARSSSEAIDALVVVADHAHVSAAGDQLNQTLLSQVGVLVPVDEYPAEAAGQTLTEQQPRAEHVGGSIPAQMHRVGGCVNNRIDSLDRQLEPPTGDEVALDPVVILAWLSAEDARAMSRLPWSILDAADRCQR